jgi:drug/metabolite transporter (DMT)-like permease
MGVGTGFALAAGLMWGLVFVAPLMLPGYPAALQSVGRYLAFGLICVPLAWLDRGALRQFTKADWWEALKLAAVGNLLYYLLLAGSIQRTGGPLTTMVIGTLPVVIAIASNLRDAQRDGRLPWRRLMPSLVLIAWGIGLVNHAEWAESPVGGGMDPAAYVWGALMAVGAAACWTWYPLRNADWLRHHPDRSPRVWATAQGVATLPLALLGFGVFWVVMRVTHNPFDMPSGPTPVRFWGLMLAVGLLASWLGTLCWNEASQRLPTTLVGQMIVFETLAALVYAYWWRGTWPSPGVLAGVACLVAGVLWAVRIKPVPVDAEATPH